MLKVVHKNQEPQSLDDCIKRIEFLEMEIQYIKETIAAVLRYYRLRDKEDFKSG